MPEYEHSLLPFLLWSGRLGLLRIQGRDRVCVINDSTFTRGSNFLLLSAIGLSFRSGSTCWVTQI